MLIKILIITIPNLLIGLLMSTFNLFPDYEEIRVIMVKPKAGHAENLPFLTAF